MNKKQPSQGLKNWFKLKGIECPKTSSEAMAIFNEHKFARFKPKSEGAFKDA